jgi:hypothetical protein
MKIWLMDVDDYNLTLCSEDHDPADYSASQKGLPVTNWSTAQLKIWQKGKNKDFVGFLNGGMLILSDKAIDAVKEFLDPNVQYLDCVVKNYSTRLTLVNVVNLLDAVDYACAQPDLTPWRKLRGFKHISFIEAVVSNQHIFKIPEFPTSRFYVSDQFRDAILNAGLVGVFFDEVWNSNQPQKEIEEKQGLYKLK